MHRSDSLIQILLSRSTVRLAGPDCSYWKEGQFKAIGAALSSRGSLACLLLVLGREEPMIMKSYAVMK